MEYLLLYEAQSKPLSVSFLVLSVHHFC